MPNESRYLAYLVRFWLTGHDEHIACRAMLVDTHSDEKKGFSDLDSLFAYIRRAVQDGATIQRGEGIAIQEAYMPNIQWLIIVLLLAAVALILCEPVCRARRPR